MVTRSTPHAIEMLAELVASPSVSCTVPELDQSNRGVVDALANWLEPLGFAVRIDPIEGAPGKHNLIATLGTGPGGLILAGHTDTVPCDPALWRSDPHRLEARDGRLYGLGATDMKGFFPLAIEAAATFRADRLREPLTLLATADEESSMSGARQLLAQRELHARAAIIGEPTALRPVRMHKGILMEAIRVTGRAGHSSDPSLGRNALEDMHLVLAALLDWRQDLQRQHQHPGFAVQVPTLNLGCLHAGDNPNRICGSAELHFDLRPLPGMDIATVRDALRARLDQLREATGMCIETHPLFPGIPAFETPENRPFVAQVEALAGQRAGAVAFATEAPFLSALDVDTLVLGPGEIDCAHQPDEYIEVAQLEPTVALLQALIHSCCTEPHTPAPAPAVPS